MDIPPVLVPENYKYPWNWHQNDMTFTCSQSCHELSPTLYMYVPGTELGLAQSVQRLAVGWAVQGSNPGGGEIFCTCPDWPWGPPSLLYDGHWVFPGVKRLERGVDHPPSSGAEVRKDQSYTSSLPMGLRGLF